MKLRIRYPTRTREVAALALVVALLALSCAKEEPAPPPGDAGSGGDGLETVVLHVEGMETPNCCDVAVKGMLMKVPGVEGCEVDIEEKTATVTVRKGTDPQTLVKGVTGYTATVEE